MRVKLISRIRVLAIVLIGATVFLFVLRFVIGGPEDDWICQNGQWVKHGNPSAPAPIRPCP